MNQLMNFLVFFSLIKLSYSFLAYNCFNSQIVHETISLSEVSPCKNYSRNITTVNTEVQLIQDSKYEPIITYHCLVTADHLISRCGKTYDQLVVGAKTSSILELSREECMDLIKTRKFTYQEFDRKITLANLKSNQINSHSDVTHGETDGFGDCKPGSQLVLNGHNYDRPLINSEIQIIFKTQESTLNVKENKLILQNGVSCDFKDESCFDIYSGNVFWINPVSSLTCDSNSKYDVLTQSKAYKITEYENELVSVYFSFKINNEHITFLALKKIEFCGMFIYTTEQPHLYIIDKTENSPSVFPKKKLFVKNIDSFSYFNSRISVVVQRTKQSVEELFQEMMNMRCEFRRESMFRFLTLARLSPSEFAYDFFQSPGYTAVVTGEVAYIIKCNAVEVKTIQVNKCYNQIPVEYLNETYFVNPRTKILSTVGEEIPCSMIMPSKFFINNNWYSLHNGGLQISLKPKILDPQSKSDWKFPEITSLLEGGIYSQQQIDNLQDIILNPVQSKAINNRIQTSLKGKSELPIGYSFENTLDMDKFTTGIGNKIVSKFTLFQDKFSYWGGVISMILFISAMFSCLIKMINTSVNLKKVYGIMGCTSLLFCSIFDSVINYVMYQDLKKKFEEKQSSKNEENTLESLIVTSPTAPPRSTQSTTPINNYSHGPFINQ